MNWVWPLPWEAAATVVAGIAAVIGAVTVGLRQVQISERQVGISERQVDVQEHLGEIEALKVRADLFDRRIVIYRAVNEWLMFVISSGRVARPYASERDREIEELGEEEQAVARNFNAAVHDTRFLFRPAVYETMRALRAKGVLIRRNERAIISANRRAERKGHEPDTDKLMAEQDEAVQQLETLGNELDRLFLPELNLGDLTRQKLKSL